MYVDKEANLLWAVAVMLAKEVFVLSLECIWLLLFYRHTVKKIARAPV